MLQQDHAFQRHMRPHGSKHQEFFPGYYMNMNGKIHDLAALSQQKNLPVSPELVLDVVEEKNILLCQESNPYSQFIHHTWFVQKVSELTTVHEVDKAYGGFNPNCLQHSSPLQLHTSPNVSATVGNILQTRLSGCLIVSSSNFVCCPPLPQIGVLSELGKRKKSHGVRSGKYGSCCN